MNDNNEKKDVFGKIKASFSGRKFKSGFYVTMLSTIVIIIVVVANLLVAKLNIHFDLSPQGMYTLSGDTKKVAKNLKDDITIYYLVETGKETDIFENVIKQYDTASDKIKVIKKDPVLYPNFAKKFNVDDKITQNSFLVVDKTTEKAKYLDNSKLYVQEPNYQTYSYETTGIDVEGQITSAIQYVANKKLPKLYVVTGHGESDVGDSFSASMDKLNVTVKTLKTRSESIPKDCDTLFINAPQSDFSSSETTMIKDYLSSGGKAIITLNNVAEKCPNFLSILKYYGVGLVKGIVIEQDASMHDAKVNYLLPNVLSNDITTQVNSNSIPVIMVNASGLSILNEKRSSTKIDPLLTTSNSSFSKVDENYSTVQKQDGDIDGPFNLGLSITDTYNNVTTKLVVYSSAYTFVDDTSSYANPALLSGTVGFLNGDSKLVSIPTKSLKDAQIYPTDQQKIMLAALVIVIIPVVILALGGVICYRRRRK